MAISDGEVVRISTILAEGWTMIFEGILDKD
jgi:hypothetical protein